MWAFAPGVGWDLLDLRSRLGWPPTAQRTAVPPCRTARQPASCESLPFRSSDDSSGIPDYNREDFGQAWADVDHNGCDTRNDILARDLARPTSSRARTTASSSRARSPNPTRERQSSLRGGTRPRRWSRSTTSSPWRTPGARVPGSGMSRAVRSLLTIPRTCWRSMERPIGTSPLRRPTSGYRPTPASAATT